MRALEGKRAVVTGASTGIGAARTRALAREGATVAAGARRVERLVLVETELSRVRFRGDDVDEIVVKALAQSSGARILRTSG